MQGVTTAIVAFIFVCMALPHIVKHRAQFYCALVAIILVIAVDTLAHMVSDSPGLARFAYVVCGFLQIFAIIALVLSAGGLSARELAGELGDAYDVFRRGGEADKEIIVPIRGRMPTPPAAASAASPAAPRPGDEEGRKVYKLDAAGNEIPEESPEPKKPDDEDKGIPLV